MSQLIHCCMLLFIIFIIAEIRDIIVNNDPAKPVLLTIWEETQLPPGDRSDKVPSRL